MNDEKRSPTYRNSGNKRVRLALFWASNYFGGTDVFLICRAQKMLEEHGLGIDLWPAPSRTDQTTLSVPDRLVEREDYDGLYQRTADILWAAGMKGYLIIVFCQFRMPAHGLCVERTTTRAIALKNHYKSDSWLCE
jgi:hypothetical protein